MRKTFENMKRGIAFAIAIVLVIGMIPLSENIVFADDPQSTKYSISIDDVDAEVEVYTGEDFDNKVTDLSSVDAGDYKVKFKLNDDEKYLSNLSVSRDSSTVEGKNDVVYYNGSYWYTIQSLASNVSLRATLSDVTVHETVKYWEDNTIKNVIANYYKDSDNRYYFKDKMVFSAGDDKFLSLGNKGFSKKVEVTEDKAYTEYWTASNDNRTSDVHKYEFKYEHIENGVSEWRVSTLYLLKDDEPVKVDCENINERNKMIAYRYAGKSGDHSIDIDVPINLNVKDEKSGIGKVVYSMNQIDDPFASDAAVSNLKIENGKAQLFVSKLLGEHEVDGPGYNPISTLNIYSKDNAGNTKNYQYKLCNDRVAPEICSVKAKVIKDQNNSADKKIKFTILAKDELSGVDKVKVNSYKIVNGEPVFKKSKTVEDFQEKGNGIYEFSVEFGKPDESGVYKYTAKAYDFAQNETKTEFAYDEDLIWDNTSPEVEIVLEDNAISVDRTLTNNTNDKIFDLYYSKNKIRKNPTTGRDVVDLKMKFNIDKPVIESENKDYVMPLRKVEIMVNNNAAHTYEYTKEDNVMSLKDLEVELSKYDFAPGRVHTIQVLVSDFGDNSVKYTWTAKADANAPSISDVYFARGNEKIDAKDDGLDSYALFASESILFNVNSFDTESGVTSVKFEFIPMDKNENDNTSNKVIIKPIDSKDNYVELLATEIYGGFAGRVKLSVYDGVGNSSLEYLTKAFVIENFNKHQSDCEIKIEPKDKSITNKGLFKDKPKFNISVVDEYSGIKKISWKAYVKKDGEKIVLAQSDPSFDFKSDEKCNKTNKHGVYVAADFDFELNAEGNDIILEAIVIDNSGNDKEYTKNISVDKTKPEIELRYSDTRPVSTVKNIYNHSRTVQVVVTDRNIDPKKDVKIDFKKGTSPKINWETKIVKGENEKKPDNIVHIGTMVFETDNDYYFTVNATDAVGLKADEVSSEEFTIDTTAPSISVSIDGGKAYQGDYYNTKRTATVTVRDKNFEATGIEVVGKSVVGNQKYQIPPISDWKDNGDVHTGTIVFEADGYYEFSVKGTDMAGNVGNTTGKYSFHLDLQKPMVEIDGVKNKSANAGEVMPVVTMLDENILPETATVEIVRSNGEKINLGHTVSKKKGIVIISFNNFKEDRDYDDLYTMTAKVTDKGGNIGTKTIVFSVNRFGSVYTFDSELNKVANSYIQQPVDVVLSETNVDKLNEDTIEIVVSKNGEPSTLENGKDYSIESDNVNGGWNRYNYIISKDNFKDEGIYTVSVFSKDAAGNTNENIEDEKTEISFGIDATAPVINTVNLESNETYNSQKYSSVIDVTDNLSKVKVDVSVDGKALEVTEENGRFCFNIPESSDKQDVVITAVDEAGNIATSKVNSVLVSTNVFVRWYNNTKVFVGSIFTMVLALLALIALIVLKQKNIVRVRRK